MKFKELYKAPLN